jgi:hypothetical protein
MIELQLDALRLHILVEGRSVGSHDSEATGWKQQRAGALATFNGLQKRARNAGSLLDLVEIEIGVAICWAVIDVMACG